MTESGKDAMAKIILHAESLQVGDVVFWYDQGVKKYCFPAMVTRIVSEHGTLDLTVWNDAPTSKHNAVFKLVKGCRHIEDPGLERYDKADMGAWELRPRERANLS